MADTQQFTFPALSEIPDEIEDQPKSSQLTEELGVLKLPNIVYGAGSFSGQYNTDQYLSSVLPLRVVRLALRYGIRAFDTSVYYGPSEVILGAALKALEPEFPRSSYQIMTKCGRYGPNNFDYSPATIRQSVHNSLKRLQTTYLDTVYLHDTEFVCDQITPRLEGNHTGAIGAEKDKYGLDEGNEGTIRGEGDQKILDAYATLRELQEQGLVKNIGITGYPLPTLLRLALLILHNPPFKPVDVILSYSHSSLQNNSFAAFTPALRERAKVRQLLTASPFSMGLLTPNPPPWHPAPQELKDLVVKAAVLTDNELPNAALRFSMETAKSLQVPLVVGFGRLQEVHDCVKVFKEGNAKSVEAEKEISKLFDEAGFLDWSWASPS